MLRNKCAHKMAFLNFDETCPIVDNIFSNLESQLNELYRERNLTLFQITIWTIFSKSKLEEHYIQTAKLASDLIDQANQKVKDRVTHKFRDKFEESCQEIIDLDDKIEELESKISDLDDSIEELSDLNKQYKSTIESNEDEIYTLSSNLRSYQNEAA